MALHPFSPSLPLFFNEGESNSEEEGEIKDSSEEEKSGGHVTSREPTPVVGDDGLYEIAMDIHASDASHEEFPDVDDEGFSLEQQIER